MFKKRAQSAGLLAEKNHLTARYTYNGRITVTKSNLDYTLINQDGKIGYFDCKSFLSDHFTYSALEPHQIDLSIKYERWCVPSGFVVWFRQVNKIVWFKGLDIQRKGPGSRFTTQDGILLGSIEMFDLNKLLK